MHENYGVLLVHQSLRISHYFKKFSVESNFCSLKANLGLNKRSIKRAKATAEFLNNC